MHTVELTTRERELITAFVDAWTSGPGQRQPFVFPPGGRFDHAGWPDGLPAPTREEVRPLVHHGYLQADKSQSPAWSVFPTDAALELVGAGLNDSMADPDERLAAVLQAVVDAHRANPAEPLTMNEMQGATLVMDDRWGLQPDAVRFHDLAQLEDLDFVSTRTKPTGSIEFWPTPLGRRAVTDPAGVLEAKAADAPDEPTASRLRSWAERIRAGDVAVSATGGTLGHLFRALLNL